MAVRVLVVSPYHGGSHAAWAEGYARHTVHDVTLLTAPARFWKWRMYGAATSLAREVDDRPDVVVATDMVDLPAFLGRARRYLADVPAVLYLHENQITYPLADGAPDDASYGFLNWRSMEAADEVWVNSSFHRDAVAEALPGLLRRFPDERHDDWVDEVLARTRVVPVGVEVADLPIGPRADPPLVVWNHRWEYDKDPEAFIAALDAVVDLPWRVALLGESFRNDPTEFAAARDRWAERVVAYGHVDRAEYAGLLGEATVAVSTARQEFFGIAAMEAAAAGALPLLPNRLSYPTVVPERFHGPVLYEDQADLVDRLRSVLTDPASALATVDSLADEVRSRYGWETIAPDYDRRLEALAG